MLGRSGLNTEYYLILHRKLRWHSSEEIIAWYGTAAVVSCDQGMEFAGEFSQLCNYLGIAQCTISMLYPRANGLIEVYNWEVKVGIWHG